MAIESHPRLDDGTPFPTLFWLTCPVLSKRAGQLEAAGVMDQLNQRFASDAGAHARMEASVVTLRERRDQHEVIADSGSPPGGGPDRIKCLHAHVAQELALPGDPAGAVALSRAGWPDCRVACFRVAAEPPSEDG